MEELENLYLGELHRNTGWRWRKTRIQGSHIKIEEGQEALCLNFLESYKGSVTTKLYSRDAPDTEQISHYSCSIK